MLYQSQNEFSSLPTLHFLLYELAKLALSPSQLYKNELIRVLRTLILLLRLLMMAPLFIYFARAQRNI